VRIDVVFRSRQCELLLLLEVKVDAQFGTGQLDKYGQSNELAKCPNRHCLIKEGKFGTNLSRDWKTHYWRDFYMHLASQRAPDARIIDFLAILKDYGMDSPVIIRREDLRSLSKALHHLRFTAKPNFSFDNRSFETLVDLKKLFEDTFRRAAKQALVRKRAGKAFRPKMTVSYWWHTDKNAGAMKWLWVGCSIYFRRAFKGIKGLGAALTLTDKAGEFDLQAYVFDEAEEWCEDQHYYVHPRRKDVRCAEFTAKALDHWSRALR
jgi:hypothetical protein